MAAPVGLLPGQAGGMIAGSSDLNSLADLAVPPFLPRTERGRRSRRNGADNGYDMAAVLRHVWLEKWNHILRGAGNEG